MRNSYLERNHRQHRNTEHNHAQRVLPPEQARVEEANAGNHDPHKGHGGDDPSHVAEVVDDGLAGVGVEPVEVVCCMKKEKARERSMGIWLLLKGHTGIVSDVDHGCCLLLAVVRRGVGGRLAHK